MKKIGVLLSGGLDSSALVGYYLQKKYQIWPVYVRCGLRWEESELYWIKRFLTKMPDSRIKSLAVLGLSLDGAYTKNWSHRGFVPGRRSSDKSVYLPARNLLLIIKSLLYLQSKQIDQLALGTLKGNPFPDSKKSYLASLGRILSSSFNSKIKIFTPFRDMTKKDVLMKTRSWPIHLSLSCINPHHHKHCGACNKCAERKKAFKMAGIRDFTSYQT